MATARDSFVLLDRGAEIHGYRDPLDTIRAHRPGEVPAALAAVDRALAAGHHCAGFLAYEAGHALEPRLAGLARVAGPDAGPLVWFGVFARREVLSPEAQFARPGSAACGTPRPRISRAAYGAAFRAAQQHIRAGDVYQVNLTFQADVPLYGAPLDLYARLRRGAGAAQGGVVRCPGQWLLSCSPELFFQRKGDCIVARPMKGTAIRGTDPASDARIAEALASDPKQRAENLMIVDLLRNDLARLSLPGSVEVPRLFEVETYPTIHQLTSTVTARLRPGVGFVELCAALFPCGSITGAPKLRAIELLDALEDGPRGVYTGAIGALSPDGEASFNVAIRTLVVADGRTSGTLGLGSGVTAGSEEQAEWEECLAKAGFLLAAADGPPTVLTSAHPADGLAPAA